MTRKKFAICEKCGSPLRVKNTVSHDCAIFRTYLCENCGNRVRTKEIRIKAHGCAKSDKKELYF